MQTIMVNYKDRQYSLKRNEHTTTDIKNEDIRDMLPHGSGINGDWDVTITKQSIRLTNYYHCMDENGFYAGMADFTVIIPRNIKPSHWGDYFRLQFNGSDAYNLNRKYDLRDFLVETLYDALSTIYAYEITE